MSPPFPPQRFLGDYGLHWVGEPMDQEDSEADMEDGGKDWMTAKKFWKPGRGPAPSSLRMGKVLWGGSATYFPQISRGLASQHALHGKGLFCFLC